MTQKQLSKAISTFHSNLKRYEVDCKRSEIEIWMNSNYFTLHYENEDIVASQEFSLAGDEDEQVIPLYFDIEGE